MTINQLSEKRKNLLKALIDNGCIDGFKRLLTDLYPDNAHFIYELLQNAEDAKASGVQFILNTDSVEFEHNGSDLFTIEDVDAITSIGFSTKRDDPTSIGKFGIGFKAVFAYTSTPEIESGEYHFRIRDLIVPDTEGLSPGSLGGGKTRFVFPFDNPKKSPQKAREEIEKNLQELNESTLLFLNNIRKIEYHLPDNSGSGSLEIRESERDGNRIEISVKHPGKRSPELTHYLRFTKVITVKDGNTDKDCSIAVAFGMEKPGNLDWKITPLNPGQVCIYFPAVKETSNLRFHLHAPFASTVARDSVRDDPANDELLKHLANLITESMSTIRDQGLLNVAFLATLPNNTDYLSPFYLPIRERVIEAFNKKKLTPTKRGDHAAASELYRYEKGLSNLIQDEDLAVLLGKDRSLPLWIANPQPIQRRDERGRFIQDPNAHQQNERIRHFLNMLDISKWTTDDFIKVLETESERVMEWLKGKPDVWHQELYVLLGDFLSSTPSHPHYVKREREDKLLNLRIVRCSDDIYRVGNECFFISHDIEPDEDLQLDAAVVEEENQSPVQEADEHQEDFHYVAKGVYSSGENSDQKKKAYKFLEDIGVSEIGEAERIIVILKQRYVKGTIPLRERHHKRDLERFIALVEDEPDKGSLFKDYFIFQTDKDCDNKRWWWVPNRIFLDSPYLDTGLKAYHEALGEKSKNRKWTLSPKYAQLGIDLKKIGKFAKAVGVETKLQAIKQKIPLDHPQRDYLCSAPGYRWTYTGINEDYSIPEFRILLDNPSIIKAKLVWRTMSSLPESCLLSRFRWNQSYATRDGHSSLVHELRNAKWIPQADGESTYFVLPCEALIKLLPKGFQYVIGQKWLEAIQFGEVAKQQELRNAEIAEKQRLEVAREEYQKREQDQSAKNLGFNSGNEAKTMVQIANAWKMQGKSPNEVLNKISVRERREERLKINLSYAEEKQYEIRARSIRSTRSKIHPRTQLRAQYTTEMNNVECQMCRQYMPFKKRNSDEDYFEAVEALKKDHFPKEHEAQYLALCPECASKYKEFVKRDKKARENLHNALKNSDEPEIRLELGDFEIRIWFKEKHWHDLKTVLHYYEEEGN